MSAEEPDTIAEARADVERTREELADTVEALAYKADVKARAHDKVDEVKAQAAEKADEAMTTATEAAGKVRETATQKIGDVRQTAEHKIGAIRADPPPRTQVVAAAAVGLAILAVVLWRKGSR
jgi:ABC-type transporter Mla subunit MlaD